MQQSYITSMCASNALADNQGTIDCASNSCVDGDIDDALCCKFKAERSSLYTEGMCASSSLADNQGTIDYSSNSGLDSSTDDALCCSETLCF